MTEQAGVRELLVADSFRVRVRDGVAEVRGWQAHLDRFRGSAVEALAASESVRAAERDAQALTARLADAACAALRSPTHRGASSSFEVAAVPIPLGENDRARLTEFLTAARGEIAAAGAGFPRLELWREADGTTSFDLSLRPLPELRDSIELRTAGPVELEHATRKGPNIGALARLNRELGAEALLLGPTGTVREGATTSLIVWGDDGDRSGRVIASHERVASVTEDLLVAAAARRLVGTKPGRTRSGALAWGGFGAPSGGLGSSHRTSDHDMDPTPAQLLGHEVWAVNALHGIRPVSHLDGVALPRPVAPRLAWFRAALERAWQPVR